MPNTNGLKPNLHYEILGEGHPVILISGYTCDMHSWDSVKDTLSEHFQVIVFDNRGTGKSESTYHEYAIEDLAKDTYQLMDYLRLQKPHIIGHSMGGSVAQVLAAQYHSKIGKTLLLHPLMKISQINKSVLSFFFHLMMEKISVSRLYEGMMPWLFSNDFLLDAKKTSEAIDRIAKLPPIQSETSQKQQLEAIFRFDFQKWLDKIHSPLLFLCGEEDLLCPPKDFIASIPQNSNRRVKMLSKMGHMFHIEKPVEFIQIAKRFFMEDGQAPKSVSKSQG